MTKSFAMFVAEEGRKFGKSTVDLAAWAPPPESDNDGNA